jgi:thioredoxin 1
MERTNSARWLANDQSVEESLKYAFPLTKKVLSDPELSKIYDEKMKKMTTQAASGRAPIVKLTTSDFDSYLKGSKPVFVDFWAVWCGPCRTMEPVVERLAAKYAGKVVFGKLNVDEESTLATRYDVQSIPTFMMFKDGRPVDAVIGAVGEPMLERLIQKSAGVTRA